MQGPASKKRHGNGCAASCHQSINILGQPRPNRQEVQFSEFIHHNCTLKHHVTWITRCITLCQLVHTSKENFLFSDSATWGMMAGWSRWCRMLPLSPTTNTSCLSCPPAAALWKRAIMPVGTASAEPITSVWLARSSYNMEEVSVMSVFKAQIECHM